MAHPRNRGARQSGVCIVPKCGRRSYARGACQTHHRQLLTTGEIKPIRPYRPRSSGTVKLAGLRVSPECAQRLEMRATKQGLSVGATIADVLENALVKRRQPEAMPARQRRWKK